MFMYFVAAVFCVFGCMCAYCAVKYGRMLAFSGVSLRSWVLPFASVAMLLFSVSPFVFREYLGFFPAAESFALYASASCLSFILYSFILFIFADLASFVGNVVNIGSGFSRAIKRIYAHGFAVFAAAAAITLFGLWNVSHITVTEYEVCVDKPSDVPYIRVVMLSDLHVGASIGEKKLQEIGRKAAVLSPDIVVVCGDLVDHSSTMTLLRSSLEMLGGIKAKYGTYFVTGNHEAYLENFPKTLPIFKHYGVNVIDNMAADLGSFVIAGRADGGHSGAHAPVKDILADADRQKPIILLDHRPRDIKDAAASGVDLEFSGHTHRGQIFPINYIVPLFNEAVYGHIKRGNYNLIVSSGVGVWNGFPIRIGSSSEIVSVTVKFRQ